MTEEEIREEKKCKCCCCKEIKAFLGMVLASFIGCLIALLIFGAIARPKFPPPMPMNGQPQMQRLHHKNFDRHQHKHRDFKRQQKDFNLEFDDESQGMPEETLIKKMPQRIDK